MKKHIVLALASITLLASLPGHAAEGAPALSSTQNASQNDLTALEGMYEMAPEFKVRVWQEGGRFMAQATGQVSFELFASGDDTFTAKIAPVKFAFKKDGSGKVTHFVLHQGGIEQIARKTS